MIRHVDLLDKELYHEIKTGKIVLAGNSKLKIYGRLACKSGKRMKRQNRIFFMSEEEALLCGFRPCSICLREKYKNWK